MSTATPSNTVLSVLPFAIQTVYEGMAYDELMFSRSIHEKRAFLRIYQFREPCKTIGYFQKKPVQSAGTDPWTRRPTGGGLVTHARDWILALSGPLQQYPGGIQGVYRKIHQALKDILEVYLEDLELSEEENPCSPNRMADCFKNAVPYDLMWSGKKIAGGALCKRKGYFLYQGSLQIPDNALNEAVYEKLSMILSERIQNLFHWQCGMDDPDWNVENEMHTLINEKYAADSWKFKY